ncbi:MAG TPA: hypothetical protein VKB51_14170 [bacterium]|nr:hypothetical protein [bacterium]
MEAMLAGKTRSVAIGALRALVVPLREHWGDLAAFREAALDVLAREGGGALYDEQQSPAHLEQFYRQVQRARATYFRPSENPAQLEQLYKELDLTAAKSASPMQQGVLWVASRLQQQVIAFLQIPRTEEQISRVLDAVQGERATLARPVANTEQLTLDRVEEVLGAFAQHVLGGTLSTFERTALAGHLLEIVREAARRPPRFDVSNDETPRNDALTALLAVMLEPVRAAELNEARLRYARFSDEEKNKRFNEFRRLLLRIIPEAAPAAPEGFETFCEAIESRLFPYPEPLQFIRSYARPIWSNGAQSSAFTNLTTPQSVQHTYEAMIKAHQGNPVVLEIARAFALRNFRSEDSGDQSAVLRETDLKGEFGWPTTMAELKAAL